MNQYKTLLEILGKYKEIRKDWRYLGGLFIIYVLSMAVEPYFGKVLFDNLTATLQTSVSLLSIAVIIGLWLIVTLLIMGSRYLYATKLLDKGVEDWKSELLENSNKLIRLPVNYHLTIQNGEKIKLLDRGAEAVWETADIFLLEIAPYTLLTAILIGVGMYINIPLTITSLLFLPVAIYTTVYFGKTAHQNQREASKYWDKAFGRIGDVFTNISLIKLFAREKHEEKVIKSLYKTASDKQHRIRRFWSRFTSFGRIIKIIPRVITLGVSLYLYSRGSISLGTILFFFIFVDTIYSPIYSILQQYNQLMQSLAKYEQLQETTEIPVEKDEGKILLKDSVDTISFRDISFSYPSNDREVLQNITFTIKKGEKIALVGHTGSGKSTITQLLMRFYEPSEGTIEVNSENIYNFTLESYRRKFSAVFQDTTLFNETIRHNLEYVRDGIRDNDLQEACRKANILDFIKSLPEKWETEVGERGLKLSGGEKQRIAIARAILADPEVLILDEATSALDTKTERLVQEAFEHLMEGRTSIIIAHRLSTIQGVDTIYFMEKGKVLASGSHRELYEKSKEYKELVDLQHDGFIKDE